MKKLLALLAFLLAIGLTPAHAITCFWVGGTGSYDNVNVASWANASGGTAGTCGAVGNIPKNAVDVATFDGASGGGTVTVCGASTTTCPTGSGSLAIQQITMGAFTGTLDFATNNPNVTLSASLSTTGTATRTLNMGNGAWTWTGTVAGSPFDFTNSTGLTLNQNSSTWTVAPSSAPTGNIQMGLPLAAFTINNLTLNVPSISASQRRQTMIFFNGGTITNLTVTNAQSIMISGNAIMTVTNGFSFNGGNASQQMLIESQNVNSVATLATTGNVTCSYCAIQNITKTGGSFTATNSFDLGGNTGVTITPPSSGSGGRIIGG